MSRSPPRWVPVASHTHAGPQAQLVGGIVSKKKKKKKKKEKEKKKKRKETVRKGDST